MKKQRVKQIAKRLIGMLLVVVMICYSPLTSLFSYGGISQIRAAGLAAEKAAEANEAWSAGDAEEVPYSPLVGELTEERERNTKTFLREDGAKEAVLYSYAVHYEDDGEWKDIDNSLYPVKTSDGTMVYTNGANEYQVWFSEGVGGEYLVKVEKDGYSISWTMPGMKKGVAAEVAKDSLATGALSASKGAVSTPGDLSATAWTKQTGKNAEERDEALRFPSTYLSEITYEDALNGLDVRYVVRPQMVEEFFEASTKAVASALDEVEVVITCEGVSAQKNRDGSIAFVNKEGEQIFSLGQPYMTDAAGVSSTEIGVSLTVIKDTSLKARGLLGSEASVCYSYKLNPNNEWLQSEERTYPVTIDPSIYTSVATADIQDASVYELYPDFPFGTWPESLRVGSCYGGDVYRTFIKFNQLPTLGVGDVVVSANLRLFRYWDPQVWPTYDYGNVIEVYQVMENWTEDTVTWDNQPACGAEIEAAAYAHDIYEDGSRYMYFDLTGLVKKWYAGTPNHGISLRSAVENQSQFYEFYFSEGGYAPECHPYVSIVYVNSVGLEETWSYHSHGAGRAGVGYVNDYTGGLTFVHQDIALSGNGLPLNLCHVYNSYDRDVNLGYGYGWRLNISEQVEAITISGVTWYRYIDEDGTRHYYYPSSTESGVWLDEMNEKNRLTVGNGNYTLTNADFMTKSFNSEGKLISISDPNGNTMTISYYDGMPQTVTDSAGRVATLYYAYDLLCGIGYPNGTRMHIYFNDNSQIKQICDVDGRGGIYAIGENDFAVADYEGYLLKYYYDVSGRVNFIETYGWDVEGPGMSLDYGWNVTACTDNQERTELIRFNHNGQAVSVQDAQGRAAYGTYSGSEGMKAKLTSMSDMQKTSVNLLLNGNASDESNWSFLQSGVTGNVLHGHTNNVGFMGNDSLYLTKESGEGQICYAQTVSVGAGKTYTFSAYVKGSEGAQLAIQIPSGTGWMDAKVQEALTSHNEWNRTSVSYTVPSTGVENVKVAVVLPAGVSGTVYADCLQMEEGGLSRFNLLSNSDFINGATGWDGTGLETADTIGTLPVGGTHPSGLDSNGFRINGKIGVEKFVSQTVNVSGSAGDSYVFGGWMKAASIPTVEDEIYGAFGLRQLKLVFMNGSTQVGEEIVADFSADTTDWQYLCASATAEGAYTKIIFRFAYPKNCNTAWFDGLQLYKEGFGERYSYTDGNLTKVVDKEDKDTEYTYDANDDLVSATDKYGDTITYTYDNKHNVLRTTALGTTTAYTYDSRGNVISTKVYNTDNPNTYLLSSASYSTDGAHLTGLTDALGNTVEYAYVSGMGLISTVTDPLDNMSTYSYDNVRRLMGVTAKDVAGNTVATVSYGYTGDVLSAITRHDGMGYGFVTDAFGNTTSITAAGNTLVTNEYDYLHALLTKTTYGNGYVLTYTYDEYDRLKTVKEGNTTIYTAYYDGDGRLYRSTDGKTGITTQYDYDLSGKLVRAVNSDGTSYQYVYDQKDSLTGIRQTAGGRTWTNSYGYDSQYRPTTTIIGNGNDGTAATISNKYDKLSRLTEIEYDLNNDETSDYTITLDYADGENGSQTTQLSSYQNGTESAYAYTYDDNGNITVITHGGQEWRYYYDCLNQLTRADDPAQNKSILYTYNGVGNILTKSEHAYTTGTLGAAISTISYTYGDNWKDQLISYNGQAISYDGIGNPTTYRGWTFSWSGRNLTGISKSGTTGTYTYNNDGLRTTKTVNGTTTTYTYQGSLLMAQQSTGKNLYFSYDTTGKTVSVNYNGTEYYYLRNGQGDIVGILDQSGTKVVSYSYDSWGKLISTEGTLANTLGMDNPLRYRGYYYDVETGFYWLLSRYYDPEVGRFINADSLVSTGQGVIGFNMFAYCLNNPVNYVDSNGEDAEALQWWFGTMWWLPLVDGVVPVGDLVYLAGCAIVGVAGLIFINEVAENAPEIYLEEPVEAEGEDNVNDGYDVYDDYGYDLDAPTNERVGKQNGKAPRDNKKQNKQIDYLTRGKDKKFRRTFHDEISGQGLGLDALRDLLR